MKMILVIIAAVMIFFAMLSIDEKSKPEVTAPLAVANPTILPTKKVLPPAPQKSKEIKTPAVEALKPIVTIKPIKPTPPAQSKPKKESESDEILNFKNDECDCQVSIYIKNLDETNSIAKIYDEKDGFLGTANTIDRKMINFTTFSPETGLKDEVTTYDNCPEPYNTCTPITVDSYNESGDKTETRYYRDNKVHSKTIYSEIEEIGYYKVFYESEDNYKEESYYQDDLIKSIAYYFDGKIQVLEKYTLKGDVSKYEMLDGKWSPMKEQSE